MNDDLPFRSDIPRHAIGVDLGGTKIEAVVLDPHGAERWRERVPTPSGDYDAILRAIAALVARAESALGIDAGRCSVGVGTPGTLTAAGTIKNANSTCLNGRPLEADIAGALGRPVRLANDADCLAMSEATDGAAAGAPIAFAVILGTGVGAGIVVEGRLLRGPNGLTGEWGHNPLPWATADELPGPACYCGRCGCIETWLSGPALATDHFRRTGERLDARQIGERGGSGATADAACDATLRQHAARLARGLAQVINLLDPHVIVLAGGVSRLEHLYTEVPRLWSAWVFGGGPVATRLLPSRHGDSSGVRGAAWLWRAAPPR